MALAGTIHCVVRQLVRVGSCRKDWCVVALSTSEAVRGESFVCSQLMFFHTHCVLCLLGAAFLIIPVLLALNALRSVVVGSYSLEAASLVEHEYPALGD